MPHNPDLAGSVFCGDDGYVVGVHDGQGIIPWNKLDDSVKEFLRSQGYVGLDEWVAMERQINAN